MLLNTRQLCCGDENSIAAGETALNFILQSLFPPHPSPLPTGERDGVRGNIKSFFVFDASQLCCGIIH